MAKVKLVKDGLVKLQDDKDVIESLKELGWVVELEGSGAKKAPAKKKKKDDA